MAQVTVKADPKDSVLSLRPYHRALGAMTSIELAHEPENDGEADLAADAFFSLYLSGAQFSDKTPVGREVNRRLLEVIQSKPSWEQNKTYTTNNLPVALTSAGILWSGLKEDNLIREAMEEQAAAENAQKRAEAEQAQADGMKQAAENAQARAEQAESTEEADQAQAQADQFSGWAQRHAEEAQKARDQAQAAAGRALAKLGKAEESVDSQATMAWAAQEAKEAAGELEAQMTGWGLGPGSQERIDARAAAEFMARNQGKIAQIAKLAGRMRGYAMAARRQRVMTGISPSGLARTQDLRNVLPQELALLAPAAHPILRAEKMAEYVDRGLLGLDMKASKKEEGPVYVSVDGSGSMQGDKEIIAKAVALGLAQAAKAGGRAYRLASWGGDRDPIYHVTSDESLPDHMRWAELFQAGGTSFNKAFRDIIAGVEKMTASGIEGVDVVFLSDGQAGLDLEHVEKWQKFQKENGARLVYVPVGYVPAGGDQVAEIADHVVKLAELSEDSGAGLVTDLARFIR